MLVRFPDLGGMDAKSLLLDQRTALCAVLYSPRRPLAPGLLSTTGRCARCCGVTGDQAVTIELRSIEHRRVPLDCG